MIKYFRPMEHVCFICIAVLHSHVASSAATETVYLWADQAPGALGTEEKDRPKLYIHPAADNFARTQTAVVVCPGGGYGGLAMGHEGDQIAAWLNKMGITACLLDYRHRGKGYGHPAPLQDVQRAIRFVRSRADEWNIATDKIGVMGFSAGGHLASSAGTHFDNGAPHAPDIVDRQSSRPDFMILCYPVIAFDQPYTHQGSQKNLLGTAAAAELVKSMSSEQQVTSETPPTFLFHTTEDNAVPPENSVQFYLALRAAKIPAEMHIFEKGRHGVGLAANIPGTRDWPNRCRDWLKTRGLLQNASWTPPDDPNPQKILREIDADVREKRYEIALAKHVWFFENALDFAPAMYGVRLSFALSDWYELGLVYPPALTRLTQARDDAARQVFEKKRPREAFHDLASINETLGDDTLTVDVFKKLDRQNPEAAKQSLHFAQSALIVAKEYKLVGKHIDAKQDFARMLEVRRENLKYVADSRFGEQHRSFTEKSFANEVTTLVAILVINERVELAKEIAIEAKKAWGDEAFHQAVDDALTGSVPAPWP